MALVVGGSSPLIHPLFLEVPGEASRTGDVESACAVELNHMCDSYGVDFSTGGMYEKW